MIEQVWECIVKHEGETFTQIRGKEFTYTIIGNAIKPSTTNQIISKSTFEKALNLFPVENTRQLQHLRGPSYLFALLNDNRIRRLY